MPICLRCALLVATLATLPRAGTGQNPLAGFDAYVERTRNAWDVPGLAIAVVHDGDVVFSSGYGVRTLGDPAPVTSHTLFANASTTKAFISATLGTLVDEGRLHWTDIVGERLPELRIGRPNIADELTITNLLSHVTGFGDPSFLWYGMPDSLEAILTRLRYVKPRSGWQSHHVYNNVTYATAGLVASRVTGEPWQDLVRERILQPLDMTETVTTTTAVEARNNVATPHDRIDGVVQPIDRYDLDNIGAAGAMYSSVSDMTRWLRLLLDSGRVAGGRLLSDSVFVRLMTPQALIPFDEFYPTARLTHPNFTAYGLGWFLQDYRGEKVAFHTGSIDGMSAIVGLLPARNVGVVVFANLDHAELRHALMLQVFDRFLGAPIRDWSAELLALYHPPKSAAGSDPETDAAPGPAPSLSLPAYTGSYLDSLYGRVTIQEQDGHLVLVRSPFLTADLDPLRFDSFRAVWRHRWNGETTVTFEVNDRGDVDILRILGVRLHRETPNPDKP